MDVRGLLDQKQNRKVEDVKIAGSDITIRVKYLLPMDLDQISKRRDLYKKIGGKMDYKLYREAVLDATVLEWNNILDGDQPWPCTKENKLELDKIFAPFRELWFKASGLGREVEEEEEDEVGN